MMDIKNFTYGGPGGQARGGQGVLSIQKNKKITRTVDILKSVIPVSNFLKLFLQ